MTYWAEIDTQFRGLTDAGYAWLFGDDDLTDILGQVVDDGNDDITKVQFLFANSLGMSTEIDDTLGEIYAALLKLSPEVSIEARVKTEYSDVAYRLFFGKNAEALELKHNLSAAEAAVRMLPEGHTLIKPGDTRKQYLATFHWNKRTIIFAAHDPSDLDNKIDNFFEGLGENWHELEVEIAYSTDLVDWA